MKMKKDIGIIWKVLIALTFIISIISLIMVIQPKLPKYKYDVRIIELDNTNVILLDTIVVDYLCDEGMKVSNYKLSNAFYASTWKDADVHIGKCAIKVKERIN